jgi:hypothetical protein
MIPARARRCGTSIPHGPFARCSLNKLYDRGGDEVTLDEIERITI